MDFREILTDVVKRVDGGKAVVLMGYDGIAIDEFRREGADIDIQLIAVEYSSILKEMKRAAELLESGALQEISVVTGKGVIVARAVTDEYFLMLCLSLDGNLGKARYMLKMAVPKLIEQL